MDKSTTGVTPDLAPSGTEHPTAGMLLEDSGIAAEVCVENAILGPSRRKGNTLSGGIKDTAPRNNLYLLQLKLSSTGLSTMSNCWDGELGTGLEKILKS